MTLQELLASLDAVGVQIWVKGGKLSLRFPKGVLTDQLKQAIESHEAALLSLALSAPDAIGADEKQITDQVPTRRLDIKRILQTSGGDCPIYWSTSGRLSVRTEWLKQVANSDCIFPIWLEILAETILLVGNNAPPINATLATDRVVYTASDFSALRDVTPNLLRRVHQVKTLFGGCVLKP